VNVEESNVSLTFDDWLASVTENINESMHYQFVGEFTLCYCYSTLSAVNSGYTAHFEIDSSKLT